MMKLPKLPMNMVLAGMAAYAVAESIRVERSVLVRKAYRKGYLKGYKTGRKFIKGGK